MIENKERENLIGDIRDVMLGIALVLFGICLGAAMVSASPYQLNLTTGQLIDLNSSNNETANITIYVLPNITNINNITYTNYTNYTNLTTFQNVTWTNITNITNITCVNCTQNYNYTNNTDLRIYNYTMNGTTWNGTFYNITEADGRFTGKTDFNSFVTAVANDFNTLSIRINDINTTKITNKDTKNNDTILWIGIAVVGMLSIVAIIVARQNSD
jgi:succinate dehydrogenase/fumarate reductase cytochrome b subunit